LTRKYISYVHDAAESLGADGNEDGRASVDDLLAADKTLSTVHGNGLDGVLTEVLSDLEKKKHFRERKIKTLWGAYLEDEAGRGVLDLEGVEDGGKAVLKLDVDDGTDNRANVTDAALGGSGSRGVVAHL